MRSCRLVALVVVCLGSVLVTMGASAATPRGGQGGEAVVQYRAAAEQGDAQAQFALGLSYFFGQGAEQSYPEAAKWYRKAAEQGLAKA